MYCCTNTNTPADSYTGGDASRDTVTSLDASCDTDASPARYADANADTDASSTARDADTVTSPSTRVADADADLAEGAIDVVAPFWLTKFDNRKAAIAFHRQAALEINRGSAYANPPLRSRYGEAGASIFAKATTGQAGRDRLLG